MRLTARLLGVLALLGMFISAAPLQAVNAKDTLTITALASTSPAPSVSPVLVNNGGGSSNYVYPWSPTDCSTGRVFPLSLLLANTDSNYSAGAAVHFNSAGNPAVNVVVPADFTIVEGDGPVAKSVTVTPPCVPGDYGVNIQISASPQNQVSVEHTTIHIQLRVGNPGTNCYLTDSSYNLLTDCSGTPVQSNGTFVIVNKAGGKIVATNPGQFYYNLIWTNTGAGGPITINLGPLSNLVPNGAQAVHAMVFDSSGFTSDKDNWDMVNQDGTPCGPSGPCTVTVGSGQTLWVTWHLEFSLVGAPSAGIATTCGGGSSSVISAGATLSTGGPVGSGGTAIGSCDAQAGGYLKR